MYRRIVLAVDPDGLAESALPILAELARRVGGEGFIVGAAKSSEPPERRAALDKNVKEVAEELTATADGWNADLIVVGSRRLTPGGGLLLGSVAQEILHRTARPVLIAGHPANEPQRSSATGG